MADFIKLSPEGLKTTGFLSYQVRGPFKSGKFGHSSETLPEYRNSNSGVKNILNRGYFSPFCEETNREPFKGRLNKLTLSPFPTR